MSGGCRVVARGWPARGAARSVACGGARRQERATCAAADARAASILGGRQRRATGGRERRPAFRAASSGHEVGRVDRLVSRLCFSPYYMHAYYFNLDYLMGIIQSILDCPLLMNGFSYKLFLCMSWNRLVDYKEKIIFCCVLWASHLSPLHTAMLIMYLYTNLPTLYIKGMFLGNSKGRTN